MPSGLTARCIGCLRVIVLPIAVFVTGAAISYRSMCGGATPAAQSRTVYEHVVKARNHRACLTLPRPVLEGVATINCVSTSDYNRRIRALVDTLRSSPTSGSRR